MEQLTFIGNNIITCTSSK